MPTKTRTDTTNIYLTEQLKFKNNDNTKTHSEDDKQLKLSYIASHCCSLSHVRLFGRRAKMIQPLCEPVW